MVKNMGAYISERVSELNRLHKKLTEFCNQIDFYAKHIYTDELPPDDQQALADSLQLFAKNDIETATLILTNFVYKYSLSSKKQPLQLAFAYAYLGACNIQKNKNENFLICFNEAYRVCRINNVKEKDFLLVIDLLFLSCWIKIFNKDRCIELAQKMVRKYIRHFDRKSIEFVHILAYLNICYDYFEEDEKFLKLSQKMIRLLNNDLDKYGKLVINMYENLATFCQKMDNMEDAKTGLIGVIELCESKNGRFEHEKACIKVELANVYIALNEYDLAIQEATEALAIIDAENPDHFNIIFIAWRIIGHSYQSKKIKSKAFEAFKKAEVYVRKVPTPNYIQAILLYLAIANSYMEMHDIEKALTMFRRGAMVIYCREQKNLEVMKDVLISYKSILKTFQKFIDKKVLEEHRNFLRTKFPNFA